jgi:hypothetical protein
MIAISASKAEVGVIGRSIVNPFFGGWDEEGESGVLQPVRWKAENFSILTRYDPRRRLRPG